MRKLLFLFSLILFISGCKKQADMDGDFQTPGVAITFDDNSVRNWYRNLNFLDSLGIKATFYISNYHRLSAREKDMLKNIRDRGHEIEYHTTNHRDLEEAVYKKGWGWVYQNEIKPDYDLMTADGYNLKHFAYPFGHHCTFLDNKLLQLFNSVRALDGTKDNSNCFALSTNSRMLYSMGIDESSKPHPDQLVAKMRKAITDEKCLVLLGHEIDNRNYRYYTSRETLRLISNYVREHNMKFYRIDEISKR